MKKSKCQWCEEDKVIMTPLYILMASRILGHWGEKDRVYIYSKEKYKKEFGEGEKEEGGMCKECWIDSYAKTHPKMIVEDLSNVKAF